MQSRGSKTLKYSIIVRRNEQLLLLTVIARAPFRDPAAVGERRHGNADQAAAVGRSRHLLMGACEDKSGSVDHPRQTLSLFLNLTRQPAPILIEPNLDCDL